MSDLRTVLEISRWEYQRWFKLKGLIITFLISVLISLAFFAGNYLLARGNDSPVRLTVINAELLPELSAAGTRLILESGGATSESELRAAVGRREIEGLLILISPDSAELVVPKNPQWQGDLQKILTAERRRLKLAQLQVTAEQLKDAMAPVNLRVSFHELSREPSSAAEKIASGVLIFLMLIGIFNSLACQMVSITGEKQLRVTEQIISAVTPQQWIDGKILGVSAYAATGTAIVVVSALPLLLVTKFIGMEVPIPIEFSNPSTIAILVIFTVAGFLFWNTFLAAFAATINDPNTSSRTGVLFLPLLPSVGAALIAVKAPDSLLTQILTQLPITAPAVIPVRIVLTGVPLWETALSLLLLLAATWFMRKLAGRIFRVGMLMYGKEPSLAEMLRWMKET